jgi:hypothetical protein
LPGAPWSKAALRHDDGHVEAGHGANQICGGELGQQRGL